MKYRQLGNTGLEVSYISLGTSSLGGVYRDFEEKKGIQVVFTALDHGINLIDTAPAYGATKSEKVLGKALKQIPRDHYFLSTKTGKYSNTDFDYSYERIIKEVEASMKRLHVEHLDLLHLHDIEFREGIDKEVALTEGYRALKDLQQQGKVRFIGIGIYPVDWCREIMYSHDIQVMICHNHYTLSDTRILELLPDLKKTGVGLINAAPMGMGLLTHRGPAAWHPAKEEDKRMFQKAVALCDRAGTPIEQLAMQFGVSHSEIPTTLVSSPDPDEILKNIKWGSQQPDMELVNEVQHLLSPVMNKDWIVG
ncbi:MAG: aldo/keto reductase [Bacteroidota bacterium]